MTINILLVCIAAVLSVYTYLAYRGIKRGSVSYYRRGIVSGVLLLFFWAGVRIYFYFRYAVVSLEPVYIPLFALAYIAYSSWKCFSLASEKRKEPNQPSEPTHGIGP
jgi:hypothetical protein